MRSIPQRMKFNELPGLMRFVDADVVHEHGFRKKGVWVWRTGPNAAWREVQDEKEWMIDNPFHPGGKPRRRERRIKFLVNEESNDSRFPFDREHVEVVEEVDPAG